MVVWGMCAAVTRVAPRHDGAPGLRYAGGSDRSPQGPDLGAVGSGLVPVPAGPLAVDGRLVPVPLVQLGVQPGPLRPDDRGGFARLGGPGPDPAARSRASAALISASSWAARSRSSSSAAATAVSRSLTATSRAAARSCCSAASTSRASSSTSRACARDSFSCSDVASHPTRFSVVDGRRRTAPQALSLAGGGSKHPGLAELLLVGNIADEPPCGRRTTTCWQGERSYRHARRAAAA